MAIRVGFPASISGTDATAPTATVIGFGSSTKNASAVESVSFKFDEPVSGVDTGDFTLTRDGSSVTISGSVASSDGGITWVLSGLTTETTSPGDYVLTLVASGSSIVDGNSNAISGNASQSWTNVDLTDSLTHHWEFEGLAGTDPVDKVASLALPDTNTVTRGTGKSGQSGVFNGSNQRFDLPNASIGATDIDPSATDFTIAAWVKLDALANDQGILSRNTANTSGFGIYSKLDGRVAVNGIYSGPTVETVTTTDTTLDDLAWHLVVARFANNKLSVWVDDGATGLTAEDTGVSGRPIDAASNFRLGWAASTTAYLDGQLDQVTTWDRYVSDGELAYLYANTFPGAEARETDIDPGDWWETGAISSVRYSFGSQIVNLTLDDFSLTKNGVTQNINAAAVVDVSSGAKKVFELQGLSGYTVLPGDYVLTLKASSNAQQGSGARLAYDEVLSWVNANVLADAVSYYRFEETSGSFVDLVGGYSLTDNNTVTRGEHEDYGRIITTANGDGSYLSLASPGSKWTTSSVDTTFLVRFNSSDIDNQSTQWINLLGTSDLSGAGKFQLGHTDGVCGFKANISGTTRTATISGGTLTLADSTTYTMVGILGSTYIKLVVSDEAGNTYSATTTHSDGYTAGITGTVYLGSDTTYEHEGFFTDAAFYHRAWSTGEVTRFAENLLTYPSMTYGAIAFWKMDETAGTRIDVINGEDLSDVGATGSVAGVSGNAVHLDGTSTDILMRTDASMDALADGYPITCFCFVNPDSFPDVANNTNCVAGKRSSTTVGWSLEIRESTATGAHNTPQMQARDDASAQIVAYLSTDYLATGTWTFIAGKAYTDSSGNAEVAIVGYKDVSGVATKSKVTDDSAAGFETATANSADFVVGDDTSKTGTTPYDGKVDGLGLYSRAWMDSELEWAFNHGSGRDPQI